MNYNSKIMKKNNKIFISCPFLGQKWKFYFDENGYQTCSWRISNFHRETCDVSGGGSFLSSPNRWSFSDNVGDSHPTRIDVAESSDVHDDVFSIKICFLHGWELEGHYNHIHSLDFNWFRPSDVEG